MRRALVGLAVSGLLSCGPSDPLGRGNGGPDPQGGGAATRQGIEISGGTLLAMAGRPVVIASDPDRDRLWVVDVVHKTIHSRVSLPRGSEPGRLAEDGQGHVFVALRGTGEIATYDANAGSLTETRPACAEPRGLTWDGAANVLRVACATGELMSFPSSGLSGASTLVVSRDLRDVLVKSDGLQVTTFRQAGLIEVASDGSSRALPPLPSLPIGVSGTAPVTFVPHVAWRTVQASNGHTVVVHQRHVDGDIDAIQLPASPPVPAYYSNACAGAIVRSALTVLDANQGLIGSVELPGVLPVDVAVSPDSSLVAVAAAGSGDVFHGQLSDVSVVTGGRCGAGTALSQDFPGGVPTAVAFTPDNTLVVQTRVPAALQLYPAGGGAPTQILLTTADLPATPGFALFHTATRGIACASCHPEGRDDGNTWVFFQQSVRTPSLAGGVLATAPFHWHGELKDLPALVQETFVTRMGGVMPADADLADLGKWLDALPRAAPTPQLEAAQVDRGHALFTDTSVGCTSCHSGDVLTNDATLDVGTGGRFQVPSLRGVSARAPYLHDGRAATLADRFTPMGGGDRHGTTSTLTPAQLDDLTAYLKSL